MLWLSYITDSTNGEVSPITSQPPLGDVSSVRHLKFEDSNSEVRVWIGGLPLIKHRGCDAGASARRTESDRGKVW